MPFNNSSLSVGKLSKHWFSTKSAIHYSRITTNKFFSKKMCFSETNPRTTNSLLHTIHYLSFVQTKMVSLQADNEYPLSVLSKNRLTGETATKHLRQKIDSLKQRIMVYMLFAIHVSPTFLLFVGVSALFVISV